MKKLLPLLLLPIILSGCNATCFYIYNLSNVERPQNAKERYGEQKIINFDEKNENTYVYEDDLIKISWFIGTNKFNFLLENRSDYSIKIIWDDAAYVNTKGMSGRVVHSGIPLKDRNNFQPPTVIPKKSKINDILIPTEKIIYGQNPYSSFTSSSGWYAHPIIPNIDYSKKELCNKAATFIGKTIKILLPLQAEETVNDYIFTFYINDFIIKKRSDDYQYSEF